MYTSNSGIPSFNKNAALQLIVAYGTCYVVYHLIRVILLIGGAEPTFFAEHFVDNIALPTQDNFLAKAWTVLTYGWVHNGFWELFSNMVWLYVFGSVAQLVIGYKQIIPMFVYSLIVGAIFYELAQLLPSSIFAGRTYMVGAQAGVVSLAIAAITWAPNYKYHLTKHFGIPLALIVIIFLALAVLYSEFEGAAICLILGGGLTGFSYVLLLKKGYDFGSWYHNLFTYLGALGDPDKKNLARVKGFKAKGVVKSLYAEQPEDNGNIDSILDKINEKGFDALTKEEKEILQRASKSE